jgi:hypothetical protein
MSLTDLLRGAMALDACAAKGETKPDQEQQIVFDSANDYAIKDMKLSAAAAIQTWAETDDLSDEEDSAARLQSLFVGIVDINKDGDISDDEAEFIDELLNYAWDYLASKGVEDDDIGLLLNDWDSAAADRIMDVVNSSLPDSEDGEMDDLDNFAFGGEAEEAVFDAVYKKKMVVRGGKKMRINKRLSGRVKLSAKQKVAIRKMHMKSHSAGATMRRAKSMKMRKRSGL